MRTKKFVTVISLVSVLIGGGSLMAQQNNQPPQPNQPTQPNPPPPPPQQSPDRRQQFGRDQNEGDETEVNIQGLTDDQKAKIKDLRVNHLKEVLPLRNIKRELEAKEQTLATSPKADLKAINSNIDEITKVDNQIMKSKEYFRQQVRSLLTEEQRLMYDMQSEKGMQRPQRPQPGMGHPAPAPVPPPAK